MRRSNLLAALLVVASVSTGGLVRAGDPDPALEALRKRFREGIALEEKGQWAQARGVFKEIAEQKMSAQIRFHLALCDARTQKLKSAREGFTEALRLAQADPDSARDVIDNAPALLTEVEERMPRLVLVGSSDRSAVVLIDGEEAGTVRAKLEIAIDPGKHVIALARGGREAKPFRTISIAERERLELELPKEEATDEEGPSEPTPPPPPKPEPDTAAHKGTLVPFFVVGSVGIASLVGSGVMIGLRQASIGEVRDSCAGADPDTGCDPALQEVADRGRRYEIAAFSLAGVGVAALGAATILYFTVGKDSPSASASKGGTVRTAPRVVVGSTATGLFVRGTFE